MASDSNIKKDLLTSTVAVATDQGRIDPRNVLVSVEGLTTKYLCGLAPITIYKWVNEDAPDFIPSLNVGRRVFFRLSEVIAYLDRQEEKAAEKKRERIEKREREAERAKALKSSNTRKRAA